MAKALPSTSEKSLPMPGSPLSTDTSQPPQSYVLAMRSLQLKNQQLETQLATKTQQCSTAQLEIEEYKVALVSSQKELLEAETDINGLLKQVNELKDLVVELGNKCQGYERVVRQLERDKENIINNVADRVIKEKRMHPIRDSRPGTGTSTPLKSSMSSMISITPEILFMPPGLQSTSSLKLKQLSDSVRCPLSTSGVTTKATFASQDTFLDPQPHHFKVLAQIKTSKSKSLIKIEHEIERMRREMPLCSEETKLAMKISMDEKGIMKQVLEKELSGMRG